MADVEDIPEEETPHVFVRGTGGSVFKLDLPLPDTMEDQLRKGYLIRVNDAEGAPYVEGGEVIAAPPTERPTLNADKASWVAWAVVESANRGTPVTPDTAEAFTKNDLIEQYGVKTADELAKEKAVADAAAEAKAAADKAAADAAQK
jgi:hypothetical protein